MPVHTPISLLPNQGTFIRQSTRSLINEQVLANKRVHWPIFRSLTNHLVHCQTHENVAVSTHAAFEINFSAGLPQNSRRYFPCAERLQLLGTRRSFLSRVRHQDFMSNLTLKWKNFDIWRCQIFNSINTWWFDIRFTMLSMYRSYYRTKMFI